MNITRRVGNQIHRMGASITRKLNRFKESSHRMARTFADKFHKTYESVLKIKPAEQQLMELQQKLLDLIQKNPNSPKINGLLSLAADQIQSALGTRIMPELEIQLKQLQQTPPTEQDDHEFRKLKILAASVSSFPGSVLAVFSPKTTGGAGNESEPSENITVVLVTLYILIAVITVAFFIAGVVLSGSASILLGGEAGELTVNGLLSLYSTMFPETAKRVGVPEAKGGTQRRRNFRLKNNLYKTTIS